VERPETGYATERYSLFHTNVDGAGFIRSFVTLEETRKEADRL
jgi:hypothetical protein